MSQFHQSDGPGGVLLLVLAPEGINTIWLFYLLKTNIVPNKNIYRHTDDGLSNDVGLNLSYRLCAAYCRFREGT